MYRPKVQPITKKGVKEFVAIVVDSADRIVKTTSVRRPHHLALKAAREMADELNGRVAEKPKNV